MKKVSKYPIKCSNTNEIVYSYNEYLKTEHWKILKREYYASGLSKICHRCNKSNIPYDFHHRTYKRLGNEYLIDIIPMCRSCHYESHDILKSKTSSRTNIWNVHKKGKKKILRKLLKPYCFEPLHMSKSDLNGFLEIPPKSRGCVLSKYFSDKTKGLHASHQWINQQVVNVCKWIRKENAKKEKNVKEITFEDIDFV
jgi:hypothetical protein